MGIFDYRTGIQKISVLCFNHFKPTFHKYVSILFVGSRLNNDRFGCRNSIFAMLPLSSPMNNNEDTPGQYVKHVGVVFEPASNHLIINC